MEDAIRLFVIGKINREAETHLVTFAEFKNARGLSRVVLNPTELSSLGGAISDLRGFVESGTPALQDETLKAIGNSLHRALLVGNTKELFVRATATTRAEGLHRLPLEIVAEDYEIASWPWEYLYDEGAGEFISREFNPISRNIFALQPPKPLSPLPGKIKILIVLGVPPDDPRTSPDEELAAIREVFSAHLDESSFEVRVLDASNAKNLMFELTTQKYDILHYFGHAGFDLDREEGYLAISRPKSDTSKIRANDFARMLDASGIRLVFLNACRTAEGAPTESPGRSSVAGAVLARGIPAVVGAQFSLPEQSAHYFASTIYNTLLTGKSVGEAVRAGRIAMCIADHSQFFDWGIPVLYSTNPSTAIFPLADKAPSWATPYEQAVASMKLVGSVDASLPAGAPSVVVERTRPLEARGRVKVALIDIDAKVGFLPDIAKLANGVQTYYHFEVAYLPIPTGYVRRDISSRPQTYLPRLDTFLGSVPEQLSADFACGLTRNPVAGDIGAVTFSEHFAASLQSNKRVSIVSTCDMRDYACEANVPFAKAVFMLCLSILVSSEKGVPFHEETAGCFFDYCRIRRDITASLKKRRFDHEACRQKIADPELLGALDALVAMEVGGSCSGETSEPGNTAKPPAKGRRSEDLAEPPTKEWHAGP